MSIKYLEVKKDALKRKIEGLESKFKSEVLVIKAARAIQLRRTPTGAIKGITIEEIENLKKTAKLGPGQIPAIPISRM